MHMSNNAPVILPAIERWLATSGPAALREIANALRWHGIRTTDVEIKTSIDVLIERKKVEVIPTAGERRTARYEAL